MKQLAEYLKHISAPPGKRVRPILVAPSLAKGVQAVIAKAGIEFKQLSLQKSLEVLRRHEESSQTALKGWLEPPHPED